MYVCVLTHSRAEPFCIWPATFVWADLLKIFCIFVYCLLNFPPLTSRSIPKCLTLLTMQIMIDALEFWRIIQSQQTQCVELFPFHCCYNYNYNYYRYCLKLFVDFVWSVVNFAFCCSIIIYYYCCIPKFMVKYNFIGVFM